MTTSFEPETTRVAVALAHEWKSRHPRRQPPQWVRAALAIEGTSKVIDLAAWERAVNWELSNDRLGSPPPKVTTEIGKEKPA